MVSALSELAQQLTILWEGEGWLGENHMILGT
jgi:hypothetical protein